ncbi:unnamed protein product [Cuscuta epithymum]|uniref:F-box/LRR-repeat protein 15/At3g58940/PEG3-like LRR domain-containing protein n=1 Tax=Cuscuta epithymum TaxID=186058 RepID=A0AAV0DUN7_9ASTE|nr:unnamed protein product [Cuscuta epithymum]
MEEQDRISDLPADILDKIMGLLWIGEAARCAILSTALRDAWYNLTELDFDESFYDNIYSDCDEDPAIWHDIVNGYLNKHNGTIRKFVVYFRLQACKCEFSKLFRSVTKKGVQDLEIDLYRFDGMRYSLPSCIFKCPTLKIFSATGVQIDPIKAHFIFPNVTSLVFYGVRFCPRSPNLHALEVPILQSLKFCGCKDISYFNINAPKLCSLSIIECFTSIATGYENHYYDDYENDFEKWVFKSTYDESSYDSDDRDMFCYDPVKEKDMSDGGFLPMNLYLGSFCRLHLSFFDIWEIVDEFSRMRLPMPALDVQYLNLTGVFFTDSDWISKFVSFLQSCPKLCELDICFQVKVHESSSGVYNLLYSHNMLKTLKFRLFSGSKSEVQFLTRLIACFPTCKKVSIFCQRRFGSRKKANIREEILSSSRLSSTAKIYLKYNKDALGEISRYY